MDSVLNRKAVREKALGLARARWGKYPYGQRVSKRFLDRIEDQVNAMIRREVRNHPSVGKTLM